MQMIRFAVQTLLQNIDQTYDVNFRLQLHESKLVLLTTHTVHVKTESGMFEFKSRMFKGKT